MIHFPQVKHLYTNLRILRICYDILYDLRTNMNIAIVDDEKMDIKVLEKYLQLYASLHQTVIEIDAYQDPDSFLKDYTPYKYTAIFLDIYMLGSDGVTTAGKIREIDPDALVIFQTSSPDHMHSAFSLHVYDYLLKPTDKDRVFQLMDDITRQATQDGKSFHFLDGKTECRLRYRDIVGIRSNGHYLHITDKEFNEYRSRMTFTEAEALLSQDGRFLLINRGTLINMDHVTEFKNGICVINDAIHLPYNVKKHKELEQTFQNYIFSKLRKSNS